MRDYGQVQCCYWTDPEVAALSDGAKLLGLYLLTGPHSNGLGCYRLPDGYAQGDLGWSSETLSKRFAELSEKGFAYRCESTHFVLLPKFLKWNPVLNPKIAKAREREFGTVPRNFAYFSMLATSLKAFGKHWSNDFETLLQTLSKQDPIRSDQIRSNTNPSPNPFGNGAERESRTTRFEDFWQAWPKDRRVEKKAAKEVWSRGKLDDIADHIIAHVQAMRQTQAWREPRFIPHPKRYLSGRRWEDIIPQRGAEEDDGFRGLA